MGHTFCSLTLWVNQRVFSHTSTKRGELHVGDQWGENPVPVAGLCVGVEVGWLSPVIYCRCVWTRMRLLRLGRAHIKELSMWSEIQGC